MMIGKIRIIPGSAGFTLIEVAMVTMILGIILAVTLPDLRGAISNFQLNATARRLVEDIRLQQQRAITGEAEAGYYIRFDRFNESYFLFKGADLIISVELPAGIDLLGTTFPENRLDFNSKGVPLPGGHITLQSSFGEIRYVIIHPITGRVRVDTIPPES